MKSSKYQYVCQDIVRIIGRKELFKNKTFKEAVKATKNKLHQISGAYFRGRPKYKLWLKKLEEANKKNDKNNFENICIDIMGFHSSTQERIEILDRFYRDIFSQLPPIHSILDVACGLNPLSIPWIPISNSVLYFAYDINKDLIEFLNRFMDIVNIQGYAEVRDVLFNPPQIKADLALILKTLPCFDQIDRSATLRILDKINAGYIIISFPVKSLGGKEKIMIKNYTTRFKELIQSKDWTIKRIEFKTELVFLVNRKGSQSIHSKQ